jgi:hypothetical protein
MKMTLIAAKYYFLYSKTDDCHDNMLPLSSFLYCRYVQLAVCNILYTNKEVFVW